MKAKYFNIQIHRKKKKFANYETLIELFKNKKVNVSIIVKKTYVNISLYSSEYKEIWNCLQQYIKQNEDFKNSTIICCTGYEGWSDYLLLHSYVDQNNVDKFSKGTSASLYLIWFSATKDDFIGEEKLPKRVHPKHIKKQFFLREEDDLADCYTVTASQKAWLDRMVNHKVDLNKYVYFVESRIDGDYSRYSKYHPNSNKRIVFDKDAIS